MMSLKERLTQMATFFRDTECRGGSHLTAADEMMEALARIDVLEAAALKAAADLERKLSREIVAWELRTALGPDHN